MNNDWFYDVLRFCNDIWNLCGMRPWCDEDFKYTSGHLEDIIEGEDVYSSNEIANEYIIKKSCYLLDMINRGDNKGDIWNYIVKIRGEWADIVYCYNLVKFKRSKENE